MRILKRIGKGLFVATLIACPFTAYWVGSRHPPESVWIMFGFAFFYIVCATVLRSQMIAGAIFGVILGTGLMAPKVNGSSARDYSRIAGVITCVIIGAAIGEVFEQIGKPKRSMMDDEPRE